MTVRFSAEVIEKAEHYLSESRVRRDPNVPGVFWVRGSGSRPYRVQVDIVEGSPASSYIYCTCPHGLTVGTGVSRCSHAVAVLIVIRDGLTLDSDPLLSVVADREDSTP